MDFKEKQIQDSLNIKVNRKMFFSPTKKKKKVNTYEIFVVVCTKVDSSYFKIFRKSLNAYTIL